VVELQAQAFAPGMPPAPTVAALFAMASPAGAAGVDAAHGVDVAAVVEDVSEGPLVYDPGHPDADGNGYVRYPNVRVTEEMVDLLDARRIYEANATVFQSAKAMLRRSLDI
jgi:flagellar basal-body rod protein FlgC